MKKFLSLLKEKLISFKNKKFDIRKFILLFAVGIFFETFSKVLGLIIVLISILYAVVKGIIPTIIKHIPKFIKFIKNSVQKKKEKKKQKKKNKFLKFKKKKEKEIKEEEKTENKNEVIANENDKKPVNNVIKNLKLISFDKFKSKLKVKKDVNGYKIINGSYRIVGNKIIDNKFNLYTLEPNIENKTEYSNQKTYKKTK